MDVTFDESSSTNKVTIEEVKYIDGASKQVEFKGKIIFPTQGSNEERTKDFRRVIRKGGSISRTSTTTWIIETGKTKRTIRKFSRFIDMVACVASIAADVIPTTYQDAVQSLQEDKWRIVMDEEM